MRALLFAGALSALISVQGSSQPVPAAGASAAREDSLAARLTAARQLAEVAQPRAIVVDSAVLGFEAGLRGRAAAAPPSGRWPGSMDRLLARLRPVIAQEFESRIPALWDAMAKAYASDLTLSEIERARDFFGSPTGRNFVRLMNQPSEQGPSGQKVTESEHASSSARAGQRAGSTLTPAEQTELESFVSSDAVAIQRVTPALTKEVVGWINQEPSAATHTKVQSIMKELVSNR